MHLPRPLINQILAQSQAHPEREVCGLIGARDGEPATCYPVANVADAPDRLFQMDPSGQIAAMKAMRERGEALFAVYHSHPDAPARPSPTDLAEDTYPDVLKLVVSLDTKGVLEMRGFYTQDGQVEEVPLVLAGME
jgi:proteasome lid subunit RPN8/RPN11